MQRTITGALVISSATRIAGRPITLEPDGESSAWMSGTTLASLRNFAVVAGRVMSLTLRGVSRDVIFRHHDGSAIDALPVVHYSDVDGSDWYRISLRFMEI